MGKRGGRRYNLGYDQSFLDRDFISHATADREKTVVTAVRIKTIIAQNKKKEENEAIIVFIFTAQAVKKREPFLSV